MPVRSSQIIVANEVATKSYFRVRSMTTEDTAELMKVRRELQVHDVESCIETWLTVDPQGLKVIESDTGEIVGACCSIMNHDDMHFVGLYCVLPKYQGFQLGKIVWDACMEHVGSKNAALNAVPGKLELYRDKGGFPVVETEFKLLKNYTTEPVDPKALSSAIPQGVTIEPIQEYHLPAIFDYDYSLMGFKRELALLLNCQEKNSRTFVAMKNGACIGFGTIKTTCLGAGRVGPLYADDSTVAEALLKHLITSLPHVTSFAMNTVSDNISAKKLLKKLSVPEKQELTRMYRKEKLVVDTKKIFALFDLNLTPF